MSKYSDLLTKASAAAKTAREIAEKAEGENRALTKTERSEFDASFKEATQFKALADRAKIDEDIYAQVKEIGRIVGDPNGSLVGDPNGSLVGDPNGSFGRARWAKSAAELVDKAMPTIDGQKSLVSGSIGVPSVIDGEIVTIGQVPRRILELVGIKPLDGTDGGFSSTPAGSRPTNIGGNSFTFLRQSVRTNLADIVKDGALKPTSVYTIAEVEDRCRVIAHLSEAIPNRYLADHAQLEDFLGSEMEYGLMGKLEQQVLSGTGVEATPGDASSAQLTGILATSGIVAVAAVAGDLIGTLRKAVTALELQGVVPTAFVLHPTDAEKVDLLREGAGTGQYLLGGPGSKTDQTLWSTPRVSSLALTAGTAVLADWTAAEVVVREGSTLALDQSGDNFTKNLTTMRLEGRFGVAVKRPSAFAKITLP